MSTIHTKTKLKVGIVGSGFGQYGLLPAFRSVTGCEVVAICGSKRPQLIDYCKSIGFTNIYSDWRSMLDSEDLDALALAVTPAAQYTIAKEAIKKGIHIFAEKPLAVNVKQAGELLRLAEKYKIVHGIDFMFPEISAWKKVKELLDQEVYGKLQHIAVNWDFLSHDIKNQKKSWKTSVADGGGALAFYFSHGLYYLEHFAGRVKHVKSSFSYTKSNNSKTEVGVDLLLQFEKSITGYAHISCNSHGLTRHQLTFQCEHGTIVLENKDGFIGNFTIRIYSPDGVKVLPVVEDRGRKGEDERVKIVRKLASRLIDACLHNAQMTPSFQEGLRVQELIEKIRSEKI